MQFTPDFSNDDPAVNPDSFTGVFSYINLFNTLLSKAACFDSLYAARLVLGTHGRGASEADVKLFADAMVDNLMQRYGAALLNFEGKPRLRLKSESPLPGNRGIKVSTELLRDNGAVVPVDYLVRNNGGWKIFDVMIEGVSYVQTFRSQFDSPLTQKSIAQVAADLRSGSLKAAAGNGGH